MPFNKLFFHFQPEHYLWSEMSRVFSLFRWVARPLCFLLAAYTLNFSIDPRDAQPQGVAEDLAFNDIESFYEFLLEGVAGIDNAVEEHEEHDQEDGGALDFKEVYLTPTSAFLIARHVSSEPTIYFISGASKTYFRLKEVDGPPPRA
jgi:hypothetical protein